MRILIWLTIAAIGVAIMVWSFQSIDRIDPNGPFWTGVIFAPKPDDVPVPDNVGALRPATVAAMRQLPLSGPIESLVTAYSQSNANRADAIRFQLSEKIFELSPSDARLSEENLSAGRLPQPGQNEVLAGSLAEFDDQFAVGGRQLTVVGRLKDSAALFAHSYLIPRDNNSGELFQATEAAVRTAAIVFMRPEDFRDQQIQDELAAKFPTETFFRAATTLRTPHKPFVHYLLGQLLLCLGGSGMLINIYAGAARRVGWKLLRDPLDETVRHRRLLWFLHVSYFGLYALGAVLAHAYPDIQSFVTLVVQGAIAEGQGPLGIAGKAYASQNVALAALVTFAVNFFIGSFLQLTVPSCILPGAGTLLAVVRALLWGLLLAPSTYSLAEGMLLHSGTLLLEGAGYILATFFGLLVPIYLFRTDRGSTLFARYRQAVMLNLKGNILVACVLVVAAIYEAAEVISMMK